MLVSAVETLVQEFDGFEAGWSDVDDRKRKAIDSALLGASDSTADGVRAAIIEAEHLAMSRRYRDFILSKIDGSFFRSDEIVSDHAVARWQLPQALREAYSLRSQYIHSAKPLPDSLTRPYGYWEVTDVDRRSVLTLEGLSRITRHVIRRFVADGPKIKTEEYDYSRERAGVIHVPMASQYWVWLPLNNAKQARKRLEGFLDQLADHERGNANATISDLRNLLLDVERLFPHARKVDRPALYVLHVTFNAYVPEAFRRPYWQDFMKENAEIGKQPSGDIMIGRTLLGTTDCWPLTIHQEAYNRYWKERLTPSGLHAPRLFEAAAALALAERYRQDGNHEACRRLVAEAVECYPGHQGLQKLEALLEIDRTINWRAILVNASVKKGA